MKLVQKQLLKGTREFEIVDTLVTFRLKTLLKEKSLTVDLSMLNPEPVLNEPFLEFHNRVKSGPSLSLLIDRPNAREFNAFIEELKQRARQEYNAFAGLKAGALPDGMSANVFEEPPDFDAPGQHRMDKAVKAISVEDLDTTIQMLQQYMDAEQIKPLLNALQALKTEPESESHFAQLVTAFDELGPQQGAVLTYAPYINILLSDDPFEH